MAEIDNHVRTYLRFRLSGEEFGINVFKAKDVLKKHAVTSVPKSSDQVFGVMNLRGRIVTVIDPKQILNISDEEDSERENMFIVVDHNGEDYALLVDEVEDVVAYPEDEFITTPRTLTEDWKKYAEGVDPRFRGQSKTLIILDIGKLLSFIKDEEEGP